MSSGNFSVDLPWTYLRYFSEFTLDFLCITLHFIIMAGNMSEGSDISGSDDSDNGNDYDINVPNYPPPANYDSSSGDEDFVNFHPGWVQDGFNPRGAHGYTGVPGSTVHQDEDTPPVIFFQMFWDQQMWDRLVTETNRYAQQQRIIRPPGAGAPKWTPVDKRTMKVFIALCLAMGILRLPCRNDYWRRSPHIFQTNFGYYMAQDQFNLIWHYLHLTNNEDPLPPVPDKLIKGSNDRGVHDKIQRSSRIPSVSPG